MARSAYLGSKHGGEWLAPLSDVRGYQVDYSMCSLVIIYWVFSASTLPLRAPLAHLPTSPTEHTIGRESILHASEPLSHIACVRCIPEKH